MTATPDELVEVRLVAMSLADYRDSSAHHDELFREFALIVANTPDARREVPGRLLALIEELTGSFGRFSAGPDKALAESIERGAEVVDLVYQVPLETREALLRVAELLQQADEYCRQGALLTIAPPDSAVVFREWFLSEFSAQIDGRPPTPWPEYRAAAASRAPDL